ncbi:MAG: oxidoreductase [Candidatus Eisenbacteria bacterium]|nr:oxidoreductase [Candidatus Eisenbacteria bacterium]
MSKLKLGVYWCATCGGCDVSILDTHERLLDIVEAADVHFWPCATDFKYRDVEAMEDGFLDVVLINGAIRNSESEHIVRLLRQKSKTVVAYGSCAAFGGIPALANFTDRESILEKVYKTTVSTDNAEGVRPQPSFQVPEGELTLPKFYEHVYKLDDIIPVDYYIPGCPPTPDLLMTAVTAIVKGELPPAGSVIAGEKTLCDECPLEKSDRPKIVAFKRPHEIIPDGKTCLLEQGLVCMGPATRSGCGSQCINANMPCRGCFGPAQGVEDQGAKMLSAIAGMVEYTDEKQAAAAVGEMVDPAGTFYRFGGSSGILSPDVRGDRR